MERKKYSPNQWRLPKPKKKRVPKTKLCTWTCRCGIKYSVRANDSYLHLLPNRIKCWSALHCRYYLVRDDEKPAGPVVQAMDLYKVLCGLGKESERKCGPAELRKLCGKKVVAMALETTSDKNRSIINSFTLEGGITVHLAPSTKGVTVYKVIRE